MNKPEPIYLTESDAIDAFAPEPGSEPRRTARESSGEPLEGFQSEGFQPEGFEPEGFQTEVFQSEVFVKSDVFDVFEKSDAVAGSIRASVPLRTLNPLPWKENHHEPTVLADLRAAPDILLRSCLPIDTHLRRTLFRESRLRRGVFPVRSER